MTPFEIGLEAVLVTAAKAVTVLCLGAMAGIVARAFCGRGMESVWPEGPGAAEADVPSSSVKEDRCTKDKEAHSASARGR